ncbi:hypothetical protein B296_00040376 [Ensete ventricosum]|uniref:Uncharacterized protein n=1 Tax=Ensete ventricosum TaxID=4639 RepID=A0A426ZQE5_ENSVE|nr:hypothetical protein B296_00040376 [Ensete ventricosum]
MAKGMETENMSRFKVSWTKALTRWARDHVYSRRSLPNHRSIRDPRRHEDRGSHSILRSMRTVADRRAPPELDRW